MGTKKVRILSSPLKRTIYYYKGKKLNVKKNIFFLDIPLIFYKNLTSQHNGMKQLELLFRKFITEVR